MTHKATKNTKFEKKLSAYALAGAAAFIAPVAGNAGIVSFTSVNQTVTQPGSYAFNLSGVASADITISAELDPYIGAFNNVDAATGTGAEILVDAGGPPMASALAFGALIDPTAAGWGSGGKMASTSGSSFGFPGDWSSTGADSYLGFYFTDGAGVHAGWADIATTTNSTASSFEVLSYAYETNPNQAITAGQLADTPEPSSMLLLALGGSGLMALRRRRAAANA